ncbi:hypothetical protein A3F03_04555 [Candidatus Roizmanbacteria bacterium RIFCSPHIGHO2_12_FULL_41_11]|uniref:Baseplate protein J-like domain-containing protein n=3 Tax=Candidatus Roizmaniibacteriota TaxID=1752723 RepID=A0A1F7JQW3_9BACT|nr:MAG: hypothetical protein A3F03_04555 [Candidatus Roizmanbacteria bacterium RIFCSPHIGHO2_12_FULL_41_11]OGK51458.1 MAG: hypothetical protein A2966_00075 [Candidatus Roizmanbacteria bacterium RIFCSPLOWO2_01_FULL_41_22]OGK57981.1 MAG: hypothetical protein A3H86_00070 [Candidatus Roizmanbacteria bacterium RIFCSPLOWO2_02_FULL_41_9]
MQLPFFSKKAAPQEDYFGLLFKNNGAVGFIYQLQKNKVSIAAQDSITYSNGWENILEDIDKLISKLETQSATQVNKVIFFLHSYLVDQTTQEIKNPYKDIIKNVAKSLELKPLGFIELHEAIKEFIKKREQAPLNAIFVELDSSHLSICVYKGDRLILSRHTPRTDDLADDIMDVFSQNVIDSHLPSKMIVYGSVQEEEIDNLKSFQWDSKLFIQTPRIEYVEEKQVYQELQVVFADQITVSPTSDDKRPDEKEEEGSMVLGFTIGEDIALHPELKPEEDDLVDKAGVDNNPRLSEGFKMDSFFTNFFNKLKLPSMRIQNKGGLFVVFMIIVIIIGGFLAFEFFLHKIAITVVVPSKSIAKTIDLTLEIGTSAKDLMIASKNTTIDISDETKATGVRETGQKAKGQVIIYNFDNQEKTLDKGTQISLKNLSFLLDQEVSVASSSGVSSDGTKQAGKSKVGATAGEIGSEYNIDKDKEMQIADLPESLYLAVSDTAFTGGSKTKVTIVAKKDLDGLEESVLVKAKKEGPSIVKKQQKPGFNILSGLTEYSISDSTYSKEISEESNIVALRAKVEAAYYEYEDAPFKERLLSKLKAEVPSGYRLEPDKLTYTIESADKMEEQIDIKVDIRDNAVKDIPKAELLSKIRAKTNGQLEGILSQNFQVSAYMVDKIFPPLPIFSAWTPLFTKNIEVTISSK